VNQSKGQVAKHLRGQVAIPLLPTAASRNLRGQVATEFLMYTTVFMFVAVAAFIVINQVMSAEIPSRENTVAKDTGDIFLTSISLAVRSGDGFTYKYTFPRTILGNPYTLSFKPDTKDVILDWEGRYGKYSTIYKIPPYNYSFVTGNCLEGKSTDDGTPYYLFNSSKCSNVLTLGNSGGTLTVIHDA